MQNQGKASVVLFFGGKEEKTISEISKNYIEQILHSIEEVNLTCIEIDDFLNSKECSFTKNKIRYKDKEIHSPYVIPCIHGVPGESGHLQALLEQYQISYFGNNFESNLICFNKILTKLWAEKIGIQTTPFIVISHFDKDTLKEAHDFYSESNEKVFVKATNQGSSIGCYYVDQKNELENKINQALEHSPYVILEKAFTPRELEMAVFEYGNEIIASGPGEILTNGEFYSFDSKYSDDSNVSTSIETTQVSAEIKSKLQDLSKKLFKNLKLKDLARIDFFLEDNKIFLNEVNTFPGMTPISLFPKLVEQSGISMREFLYQKISAHVQNTTKDL